MMHYSCNLHLTVNSLNSQVKALNLSKSYKDIIGKLDDVASTLALARAEAGIIENSSRPIFSIPAEIFAQIFEEAYVMQDVEEDDVILCSLRISHVSRHWRAVALTTPAIWTTFSTSPLRTGSFSKMLLCRAGNSPLNIILHIADSIGAEVRRAELLNLLLPAVTQWRSLLLRGTYLDVHKTLADLTALSAPRLQRITVSVKGAEHDHAAPLPQHYTLPLLAGGAQNLRHLTMRGIGWRDCRPPLAALTHLHLSCMDPISYATFHSALREAATTLVQLELDVSFEDKPFTATIPMIAMLSMRTLIIYNNRHAMFTILLCITAPSLVTISLHKISFESRLWWRNSPEAKALRFPMFPMLEHATVSGWLDSHALKFMANISYLVLSESGGAFFLDERENLHDFLPRLSCIACTKIQHPRVRAFAAARQAVGLAALRIEENDIAGIVRGESYWTVQTYIVRHLSPS